MPITCIHDDGEERCYINDAPSNEDCESLLRYFEKYWNANVQEIYNVGSDAKYKISVNDFIFELNHHSSVGNYLRSDAGSVSSELKDVIADLDKRLA